MRNESLAVIGGLVFFVLNFFVTLFPFYLAYLIIEPRSFMGIVGVFFLGLVIVPLGLFILAIIKNIFFGP